MSERKIVCEDLRLAIDDLRRQGLRLDVIYPADDPHTAILSGDGRTVRLTTSPDAPAISRELPPFRPEFILARADSSGGQGRAGMRYRDLIPSRLGGRYIASHITIADGGPVQDWVHYHRLALQLIYVRRGWVRVVYEDQGDPFVMSAGDLVLQPPGIRHRVLESSDGLEVIEISCPALHETLSEHEMTLPNGARASRDFGGQRFCRHVAENAPWTAFGGGEAQETAIRDCTGGLADARTVRAAQSPVIGFAPHDGELVFGFVLDGKASLDQDALEPGDAFVIPPGQAWQLTEASADFRLLHVTTARLPGHTPSRIGANASIAAAQD